MPNKTTAPVLSLLAIDEIISQGRFVSQYSREHPKFSVPVGRVIDRMTKCVA
jgi:hypothetical protein